MCAVIAMPEMPLKNYVHKPSRSFWYFSAGPDELIWRTGQQAKDTQTASETEASKRARAMSTARYPIAIQGRTWMELASYR